MYTQPRYFALSGAEQLLTSQVVFPTGSHRLGLAVLIPRRFLSSCHEVRDPGERGTGWVGWAGAAEPQSCPPRTTVAPTNTNHPRACQWDKAAYSRQAEELPGRAGAEPEEAAPPPGCSAPQSSTSPAKWETCLSETQRKRQALSLSLPV